MKEPIRSAMMCILEAWQSPSGRTLQRSSFPNGQVTKASCSQSSSRTCASLVFGVDLRMKVKVSSKHSQNIACPTTLCLGSIGLGDWNWTPEDNEAIGLGTLLPVVDHEGTPIPTRWHAKRAVDYAVTSQTNLGSSPELDSHVLGDHKIYKLRINLPQVGKNPTTIRPVTRFHRPQHLSTQQWRKTLQNVFKDIQCPPISNTETEWNTFCALPTQKWQQACPNHECEPSSRAIGSVPQAIPMNAKRPSHTSFRSRRLAKFLGRLREWQRQQNKNHPTASLWKRIQKAWPAGIPTSPNIQETESLVEQELAAELSLLGKARLRN